MKRIALLALISLLVWTTPAGANDPPRPSLPFSIQPVGGTPGTSIGVEGTCDGASEGWAFLETAPTSDVNLPPVDSEHFVVNDRRFYASLQNPYASSGAFPTDARVRIECGVRSASVPFQGSDIPMSSSPSIFTSLGAAPCGRVSVPPGEDGRIHCPSHIKGFASSGALAGTNFYSFTHSHGRSVAVGDVNADGQLDVLTGAGQGPLYSPHVMVHHLDGNWITGLGVYGGFDGSVNVAVGDVTGDGNDDIVTGPGPGGGPHVNVLVYNPQTSGFESKFAFYAYETGFGGGVRVAVGPNREIITAPGPGGGPHVKRFNRFGTVLGEFMAYEPGFTGGVFVASDQSSGRIITGAGAGGGPHVRVFTLAGAPAAGFYAYDSSFTGGVDVALGRVGGATQIVTGAGAGGHPHVRTFNLDGSWSSGGFYAYAPFAAGVRVAADS